MFSKELSSGGYVSQINRLNEVLKLSREDVIQF